jgi:organic radical activating enzyme
VSQTEFPFKKITDQSIEEIHNSDEMKQFRLDLLNGVERPEVCTHCYQGESAGFHSYREAMNLQLEEFIQPSIDAMQADGTLPDPILRSWDIRYSNLCNLKCRTCGDDYSTTWAAENGTDKELFAFETGTDPLEHQYKNVRKIYFAGGEPMIMPEHYATLKKLIEMDVAKDINLFYNTNMTKLNYNREYLPDYWKEFKKVTLGLSIDHYGERANYIRNGAVKWKKIEENIRTLLSYDKMEFRYHPTVSVFNIATLPELHKYLFENGLLLDINQIQMNILYYSLDNSVKTLPKHLREKCQENITNHIEWLKSKHASEQQIGQWNNLHDYLYEDHGERQEQEVRNFVFRTNRLDFKRGESFRDTFPEYREWWDSISNAVIPAVNVE